MSGLWNSIVGGNDKEADWNVSALFYCDSRKKYFSVSEVDKEETPIVYAEAHNISFNETGFGLNYTPLNFVNIFHIDSRKGLLIDVPTCTTQIKLILRSLKTLLNTFFTSH